MRRECFTVVDLVFDGDANPISMTEEANCIALPLLLGYVRVSKGEKQETRMQETAFRADSLTHAPR